MALEFITFWLRETLANLVRNRLMSLLALSTVAIGLFILGGFYLAFAHVRNLAQSQTQKLDITVILDPQITAKRRKEIYEACRIPHVADLQFASKDQVLREMKRDVPGMAVNDLRGKSNPLSDELRLKLKDPEKIPAVVAYINTLKGKGVDSTLSKPELVERLLGINRLLALIGSVTLLVLSLAILAIIYNTIRLTVHARRREIRIMELVGATRGFIRVPFVLEGAVLGLFGALIASTLLGSFYAAVMRSIPLWLMPLFATVPHDLMRHCALGMTAAGLIFGFAGACFSLERSITRAAQQA